MAIWTAMTCQKISILHVDDEKDFLALTKNYLENVNENISVDTVSSPREVINILEKRKHDAIVSDLCMPGITGLELHDELQERGIDMPFIILSGTNKDEMGLTDRLNAKISYLKKHTDVETLYTELSDLILEVTRKSEKEATSYSPWNPLIL
ncbi:MAG: response regulator [Candidatus Hodarchaeales archaeon]|jgi:DNA-binding NtrC family response regulator